MRARRLALAVALAAGAVAGCGGGSDDPAGPLDDALGYLPADAPLAIAIETDPDSPQLRDAQKVAARFPFAGRLLDSFEEQLGDAGLDFRKDVRPLLGNPFVIGAPDARALQEDDDAFIGAIDAKDSDKVNALLDSGKRDGNLREAGETDGVRIYTDEEGDVFGVDGSKILFADGRDQLERAIETHGGEDRLDEDDFEAALEGQPEDAALRVYGDLERILAADPDTARARKVKWVQAARTFGVSGSIAEDGLAVDFRLATEGLDEADLPLASGAAAPPVLAGEEGQVGIGLRDLTQATRFAEGAGRAINPGEFRRYAAAKQTLDRQLDIDLDRDVIDQFEGSTSLFVDLDGRFGARSEIADPQRLEEALSKAARAPGLRQSLGLSAPGRGADLYTARFGERAVSFGVVDGRFVVTNDAQQSGEVVSTDTEEVAGAEGALVALADGEGLANALLERLAGDAGVFGGSLFTGPLGELKGSVSATPDGLTGRLTLGIEK